MDLLLAEHEAKNKKRKAAGQDPLPLPPALASLTGSSAPVAAIENGPAGEEDAASKRRKMLQEALELDRDDDEEEAKAKDKGKGKAPVDKWVLWLGMISRKNFDIQHNTVTMMMMTTTTMTMTTQMKMKTKQHNYLLN